MDWRGAITGVRRLPWPGFRSGVWWKKVIAVVGYGLIVFMTLGGPGGIAVALFGVALVLLIADVRGIRSALPLVGSNNRMTAAAGWAVVLIAGLVFVSAVQSSSVPPAPSKDRNPQSIASASSSPVPPEATTAPPTERAVVVPTAATRPPATASPAPEVIAGLALVDITKNLEPRGFRCEGPRQLQTMASWTCSGTQGADVEFRVDVIGASPTRVRSVNATVTQYQAQPSDATAANFLGFIATLPYTDAEPQRARAWVEANIARRDATMTIGTARFSLSRARTGRAHSLDIVAVGAR